MVITADKLISKTEAATGLVADPAGSYREGLDPVVADDTRTCGVGFGG